MFVHTADTTPLPPSRTKIAAVVLLQALAAVSFTLASKASLNQIHSPIALLTWQTLVQIGLIGGIGSYYSKVTLLQSFKNWKEMIPLSLARLAGVLAKTLCLQAVDASFYLIARGLLLPFTVILSLLVLHPRPRISAPMLASIFFVIFGFALGFLTDVSNLGFNVGGLALGIGSSMTTAIESVVVKRFTLRANSTLLQLAYMSSALQLVAYLPLLLFSGEVSNMLASTTTALDFLQGALVMGITNTLFVVSTFAQISLTTPITHTVVAAARGVVQSLLAALFFREVLTWGRLSSIAIISAGTIFYCLAKEWERSIAYLPIEERDTELGSSDEIGKYSLHDQSSSSDLEEVEEQDNAEHEKLGATLDNSRVA